MRDTMGTMPGEQEYQHDRHFEPPNFLTCPGVPELTAGETPVELPSGLPVSLLAAKSVKLLAPPRRKKRIWLRWLIVVFLFGILGFLSPLLYGGVRAGLAVRKVKISVNIAQQKLLDKDFAGAQIAVEETAAQLAEMRAGLEATGFWQQVPYIRTQLLVLEDTARAAETALRGIKDIVEAMASIQSAVDLAGRTDGLLQTGIAPHRSFQDLTPEEKRAVLARFHEVLPQLHTAREQFKIALDAWQRIPQDELYAPLRDRIKPFAKILPELEKRVDQAVSLMDVFLPMAGYPQEKNYLVLLQNADELRPTGGFIGTVGTIQISAADLKQLEFKDVYAIDNPVSGVWKEPVPEPLARELGVPALFLRDANWSPDFPQSAERLMDYYHRELSLASVPHNPLDGALALQPGFFEELLRLTGPIVVDGREFNADNFFDQLEFEVEMGFHQKGKPVEERKKIVSQLGDELIKRLMSLPSSRWGDVLDLFINALIRKDILIYTRDAKHLALLDAHTWSGRTQAGVPDYLWVIDANLAALKTDGVMDKEIRYSVDMTNKAGPTATVTLHYRNTNRTISWRYSRYRDYVRVYVPDGSQLISSSGAMLNDITKTGGKVVAGKVDVTHDLGKTVFGAFWSIEPGETRDLTFTYRLPSDVVKTWQSGKYGLFVQKQPGSKAHLTLNLLFGKNLASAAPSEVKKEWGDQRYRTTSTLEMDQKFEIRF